MWRTWRRRRPSWHASSTRAVAGGAAAAHRLHRHGVRDPGLADAAAHSARHGRRPIPTLPPISASPRPRAPSGSAVGKNPISFVVPCHRVLGKSGGLCGYHWGLTRKQAILGWEAGVLRPRLNGRLAQPDDHVDPVDFRAFGERGQALDLEIFRADVDKAAGLLEDNSGSGSRCWCRKRCGRPRWPLRAAGPPP